MTSCVSLMHCIVFIVPKIPILNCFYARDEEMQSLTSQKQAIEINDLLPKPALSPANTSDQEPVQEQHAIISIFVCLSTIAQSS